jgi:bifunctional N-acetylglucosamine-1-phosphate-uridyltransferase/glucosamine-1-phosphate-acetyltransferase GlmU-like protein
MNIVILAAGNEHGDLNDRGYPLFLSELDGEMMIERLARSCLSLTPDRMIFAMRMDDIRSHHVDSIIRQIAPSATIVQVAGETCGAACTAMLTIDHLDLDGELLILNATDLLDVNLSDVLSGFRSDLVDAGTIIFDSLHPRYSFVRLEGGDRVVEAAEKNPISRNATAGCYWFRRAAEFVRSCEQMISKDANVSGRFYVSLTLNEMILAGRSVAASRIEPSQYHPVKSPRQLAMLENVIEQLRGYHEE